MAEDRTFFFNNQAVGNFQSFFQRRRGKWFLQNEVNPLAGDLLQSMHVAGESDGNTPVATAIDAWLLDYLNCFRHVRIEHQQIEASLLDRARGFRSAQTHLSFGGVLAENPVRDIYRPGIVTQQKYGSDRLHVFSG